METVSKYYNMLRAFVLNYEAEVLLLLVAATVLNVLFD